MHLFFWIAIQLKVPVVTPVGRHDDEHMRPQKRGFRRPLENSAVDFFKVSEIRDMDSLGKTLVDLNLNLKGRKTFTTGSGTEGSEKKKRRKISPHCPPRFISAKTKATPCGQERM